VSVKIRLNGERIDEMMQEFNFETATVNYWFDIWTSLYALLEQVRTYLWIRNCSCCSCWATIFLRPRRFKSRRGEIWQYWWWWWWWWWTNVL